MSHFTEKDTQLEYDLIQPQSTDDIIDELQDFNDVCLIILPTEYKSSNTQVRLDKIGDVIKQVSQNLGSNATLVVLGETVDLITVHFAINNIVNFHHWIVLRKEQPSIHPKSHWIQSEHVGALIYTKYDGSLNHVKTRTHYTYCPACERTTKDYGGKKHTYHQAGTLISDVWRDMGYDFKGDIAPLLNRFADLFAIDAYNRMRVIDTRTLFKETSSMAPSLTAKTHHQLPINLQNQILHGDCLDILKEIPDNSIDFIFVDPPYNLGKKYRSYSDDMEIENYFAWCDEWLSQLIRILKPSRTLAILNIPLWAIRHFKFLKTLADFQGWIAWDALSYPVRLIMPAHYAILCFSKGEPRQLPAITGSSGKTESIFTPSQFSALKPLADNFCIRPSCIKQRNKTGINDRRILTDIWSDIHRLKHNARRVDHPTQLPSQLMYRLISIFTQENETVLDCFNGSGTTTLSAHQLNRHYIGVEQSKKYVEMAEQRHREIEMGMDPFRKSDRKLTAKNSPVARMPKQKYEIPKKTLQLEVRRVAQQLERMPTRDDVAKHAKYPIHYYDDYFASWGEVCAAVRNKGMSETKADKHTENSLPKQLRLF